MTRGAGGHAGRALPTLMVDGMVRSHVLTDAAAGVEQLLGSGGSQHATKLRTPSQIDLAAAAASTQSTFATSKSGASPAGHDVATTSQFGIRKSTSAQRAPVRPNRETKSPFSSSGSQVDENPRDLIKELSALSAQHDERIDETVEQGTSGWYESQVPGPARVQPTASDRGQQHEAGSERAAPPQARFDRLDELARR